MPTRRDTVPGGPSMQGPGEVAAAMKVEIRFVKASASAITLDLHVPAHLEAIAKPERFELQWREAKREDDSWATASSSLKLRRCTKGNLKHRTGYMFRARAFVAGEGWSEFGPETKPLLTTLPEVPETCSEGLRVAAIVAAAQSEKETEKSETSARLSARREAQLLKFVERKAAAAASMQAAVKALEEQQDALRLSVLNSLGKVRTAAERNFVEGSAELTFKYDKLIAAE
eukprot:18449-Pleurochrysis_carterae.AAC.1